MTKTCTKCGHPREISEFYPEKNGRLGVKSSCKICVKAKSKSWRNSNSERAQSYYKSWRTANIEKARDNSLSWDRRNPDKRRKRVREAQRRRYAAKVSSLGWFPENYEEVLFASQEGKCFYCRESISSYHVEHKTPLMRGGPHSWENVCLSCPDCNWSKGSKTAEEFLEK